MERKHEIRPLVAGERPVGPAGPLHAPADTEQRREDLPCPCAWPFAHAARNVMVSASEPASSCSRRSATTRRAKACAWARACSGVAPYAMVPGSDGISAIHRPRYNSRRTNLEENASPWNAEKPLRPSPLPPIRRVHAMCIPCISAAAVVCSLWGARYRAVVRSAGSRSTPPTREACATFAIGDIESNSRWRSRPESRLEGCWPSDGGLA